MTDMLTSLIVANFTEHMCVYINQVTHLTYVHVLVVNYASVKLGKKKYVRTDEATLK